MWIGSLVHEDIHRILRKIGVPYMAEVNMTPWLPRGWGGTADAFVWNPDLKAFVLTDFKTSKGESMKYIANGGAKIEHVKQTSAYWHAAKKMGLPLVKKIGVYYLPKNDTRGGGVEPLLMEFEPVPVRDLAKDMKYRHGRVTEYVDSLPYFLRDRIDGAPVEHWVTDALEPVQQREQKLYWDRYSDTWELKLVPHWSAAYCPYPHELCDCGSQGTTKIGFYDFDGTYYPRDGYEDIAPLVSPS
ncbi:MAG: hypothetical protein KGL39_29885 [Patescibacteria group bacterium]|nr:hypothetical protein [Patescibacteria group bacterium]